jgi:hypothetical protein
VTTNQTFLTDKFRPVTRFVLVNNRVPRTDQHCALCHRLMEKGYIRDVQTRLNYCDTRCFGEWAHEAVPAVQNRGREAS